MIFKFVAAVIVLLVFCGVAAAQEFCIRSIGGLPLYEANVDPFYVVTVEMVPAGVMLRITGEENERWKVARNGRVLWMDNWLGYQPIPCTPELELQKNIPTVDNCCQLGWDCGTDQKRWEDGWHAYKAGHCRVDNCCYRGWDCQSDQDWSDGAKAFQSGVCHTSVDMTESRRQISQILREEEAKAREAEAKAREEEAKQRAVDQWRLSSQPITSPIPEGVNNCCFLNRECNTQEEWEYGWELFAYDLCHVPDIAGRIQINGSSAFVAAVRAGLRLQLSRSPKWYRYTQQGLRGALETPGSDRSWVRSREAIWRFWLDKYSRNHSGVALDSVIAGVLVHEACHVHRYRAGLQSGGYVGEKDCLTKEIQALEAFDAPHHVIKANRWTLKNIDVPEFQWWVRDD